jgi:hypothetical protein
MSLPLHLKSSKEFFKYSKKSKLFPVIKETRRVNLVSQDVTLWNIFYHLGGK